MELQLCDPHGAGRMGHGGATWQRRPVSPLDEEWEGGLGSGLLDAREPPPQELGIPAHPRTGGHGQVEPSGDLVERIRPYGPAKQAGDGRLRCRDPSSEGALRGHGLVGDRDQFQIGLTERHDHVGRAPAGVTTALKRGEAVPLVDLLRRCGKVGHCDQYVVELQTASLGEVVTGWSHDVLQGRQIWCEHGVSIFWLPAASPENKNPRRGGGFQ